MGNLHKIPSTTLKSVFIPLKSEKATTKGGEFTMKSISTGKDYTYKIVTKPYKGKTYTHISVESGYMKFKHIGTYFKGKVYKNSNQVNTPSAKAIGFVLSKVENGEFNWLDEKMELYHLGKCLKCGKTLTDSDSIKVGLGKVCQSK
jgi:hypothetical protein